MVRALKMSADSYNVLSVHAVLNFWEILKGCLLLPCSMSLNRKINRVCLPFGWSFMFSC